MGGINPGESIFDNEEESPVFTLKKKPKNLSEMKSRIERIKKGDLPTRFGHFYCYRVDYEHEPFHKLWVSRGWPYYDYDTVDDFLSNSEAIESACLGASCFEDPYNLLRYFEGKGGTSGEVVLIYGKDMGLGIDDENLIEPHCEVGRMELDTFQVFMEDLTRDMDEDAQAIDFVRKSDIKPLKLRKSTREETRIYNLVADYYRDGEYWVEEDEEYYPADDLDEEIREKIKSQLD